MPKPILNKSPLAMVLVDLRFTPLPARTLSDGLELFRERLFHKGFSVPHEAEMNQIEVISQGNNQPNIKTTKTKRWDYLKTAKDQCITLTEGSLTLRSTVYNKFEEFYETWDMILCAFFEVFKNIENAGMLRLGLRHMDVFMASHGNKLTDYINKDWLTPQQLTSDDNTVFFNRCIQKTAHGVLRVEIEERLPENGFINILPRDIVDPEPVSLTLVDKPYWQNFNGNKFAIVDIDHAWTSQREFPSLTKDNISHRLHNLYNENSSVFWGLLSEKAEEEWEKSFQ